MRTIRTATSHRRQYEPSRVVTVVDLEVEEERWSKVQNPKATTLVEIEGDESTTPTTIGEDGSQAGSTELPSAAPVELDGDGSHSPMVENSGNPPQSTEAEEQSSPTDSTSTAGAEAHESVPHSSMCDGPNWSDIDPSLLEDPYLFFMENEAGALRGVVEEVVKKANMDQTVQLADVLQEFYSRMSTLEHGIETMNSHLEAIIQKTIILDHEEGYGPAESSEQVAKLIMKIISLKEKERAEAGARMVKAVNLAIDDDFSTHLLENSRVMCHLEKTLIGMGSRTHNAQGQVTSTSPEVIVLEEDEPSPAPGTPESLSQCPILEEVNIPEKTFVQGDSTKKRNMPATGSSSDPSEDASEPVVVDSSGDSESETVEYEVTRNKRGRSSGTRASYTAPVKRVGRRRRSARLAKKPKVKYFPMP